ncbi:MAG: hypothetical protein H7Z76_07510 [Methylotenera sp.]|nr:hypothetical protein [Flavobacterium sp.]
MSIIKNTAVNVAIPSSPLSQNEFIKLIKDGEKGAFKAVGTFGEFKKDVLSVWKKRHGK